MDKQSIMPGQSANSVRADGGWFDFDQSDIAEKHDQEPFGFQHNLSDHPLMQLPELVKLVAQLDRDKIEFNRSDVGLNMADAALPHTNLSPEKVVEQIQACQSWMVIKDPRSVPAYQTLVNDALREIARKVGMEFRDMHDIRAFIFVSSPNSTTPFHIDGELNFFAQCHGTKTFAVFDNRDHAMVSVEDEEHDLARTRYRPYDRAFEKKATYFELSPGGGCYIPMLWPHWLKTGSDTYSISMAITYKTHEAMRVNKINLINPVVRKLGITPTPPGVHLWWDEVRFRFTQSLELLLGFIRRSERLRALLRSIVYGKNANYYYASGTTSSRDKPHVDNY